jgi:hypothetical protein
VDASTWVAIGAALTGLAALYFNAMSVRAAKDQTAIQRQLRIDAAQPYVWADVRTDPDSGFLLDLAVGNAGPTIATNVRVRIDPPVPSIDQLRDRVEEAYQVLAGGITSLPPGRTLTWTLGQANNLVGESGPRQHTFTVSADGPFGTVPPLSYVIDLADWRGQVVRPGELYRLTKAVEGLTAKIASQ